MKNIIVTLIEFLAIGLLVSWERSIIDWLWLLPIFGYSGFQLISEKNKKVEANDLDVDQRGQTPIDEVSGRGSHNIWL